MGLFDLILIAVWGGVAYVVATEGAIGAVTTFFCALLGGLCAMNFFEPLAEVLDGPLGERADVVALLGLFAAFVTGGRLACEQIAPRMLALPTAVYELLRWGGGAATGYVTMAVCLVAVHVSPLPREFLGFRPERANLFEVDAPDRRWLAFTRYVSTHALDRGDRLIDPSGRTLATLSGFDNRTGYDWGAVTSDGSHPGSKAMPSFVIRYADRRQNGPGAAAVVATGPAPRPPSGPSF